MLDGEQFRLDPPAHRHGGVLSGPRVGVAGAGGSAEYPWRFWLPGEPTVSAYRAAKPRTRARTAGNAVVR
jgi:DNA-3-methyladenine glycosylase